MSVVVRTLSAAFLGGITMCVIRCTDSQSESISQVVDADGSTRRDTEMRSDDAGDSAVGDGAAQGDGNQAVAHDACAPLAASVGCTQPSPAPFCDGGWCLVRKGCFVMGSPPCEWGSALYAENQTETRLTHDFWIQQTELTQAEWTDAGLPNRSGALPSGERDCIGPDCPASFFTWYEALAFANRLSERRGLPSCYVLSDCDGGFGDGMRCGDAGAAGPSLYDCLGYRLPTEAEWEYAARAGTTTAFFNGDITKQASTTECYTDPKLEGIAWYCANSGTTTHSVALKSANPLGLFDIAGNAAEMVSDSIDFLAYDPGPRVDPGATLKPGLLSGVRGGSAWSWSPLLKSDHRLAVSRGGAGPGVGVRLVRRAD